MNGSNRVEMKDGGNAFGDENWYTGPDMSPESDIQRIEDGDKKISELVEQVRKIDAGNGILTNKIKNDVWDNSKQIGYDGQRTTKRVKMN